MRSLCPEKPGGLTEFLPGSRGSVQTAFSRVAFDALALTYDEHFTFSRIGRAQREAVRRELNRAFHPGHRVLEINCGTGIDAVSLARRGVEVLACDISSGMIEQARQRADRARRRRELQAPVEFRVLATEEIGSLRDEGLTSCFDGAFSNFAGLNCVEDLGRAAHDLSTLVKPGATVLICVFGRRCAWEIFWYLAHGNPAKAFRRLGREVCDAQIADDVDVRVRVRYPSVSQLASLFAPALALNKWRGIGVTVPPTYLKSLAERFPRLLDTAVSLDRWLGRCPGVRNLADHVLLAFERRT